MEQKEEPAFSILLTKATVSFHMGYCAGLRTKIPPTHPPYLRVKLSKVVSLY